MAPAAGLHWHEVFVLPQDTHGADLMTILVVVTPLPPAVNVPDLEGYLQTKPVTLERSSAASPFPRRPVPLAQVLDQGGRLAAAMTTLPRRRLPHSQGRNCSGNGHSSPGRGISQTLGNDCSKGFSASGHIPGDGCGDSGRPPLRQKMFSDTGRNIIGRAALPRETLPENNDCPLPLQQRFLRPQGDIVNAISARTTLGETGVSLMAIGTLILCCGSTRAASTAMAVLPPGKRGSSSHLSSGSKHCRPGEEISFSWGCTSTS